MTKEKIFITGISSEMMCKLVPLIDPGKFEIIGITRDPDKVILEQVKVIKGGLEDLSDFKAYIQDCSIIIHAAAVTHSNKEEDYYKVNLLGTRKLVDLARTVGVGKFIFISSNTAGIKNGAYAKSKYLAEKYIEENISRWTIYRPAEVFGGRKNEGIDKLIKNIATKRILLVPLGVPNPFHPLHIDDLVCYLSKSIFRKDHENRKITIYGSEGYTFQKIIKIGQKLRRKKFFLILINRNLMLLLGRILSILPFHLGIVPDQIYRLYRLNKTRDSAILVKKMILYHI